MAFKRLARILTATLLCWWGVAVAADEAAVRSVATLHDSLIDTMRDAAALRYAGRRERLAPVIGAQFDLPYIARIVLGKHWKTLGASEQARMVDVFRRLTVATYASRFDGYSGEQFVTRSHRPLKKGRMLVRTELEKRDGDRVRLDYILHQTDGRWQIVNIVADGVSELALKRADYASMIKAKGFAALMDKIEQQTAALAAKDTQ